MRSPARALAQHYAQIILTLLAAVLGAAALIVAVQPRDSDEHTGPPRSQQMVCALLGAIIGDNDSPRGLSAAANQLYAEDGCGAIGPPATETRHPN